MSLHHGAFTLGRFAFEQAGGFFQQQRGRIVKCVFLGNFPAVSPPANIGFMNMGHNMRSGQMDQMGMMMDNMGRMMHMVTNLVGGQLKPRDEDCRVNVFTSPRKAERSTSAGSSGSLQDSQTENLAPMGDQKTEAVVRQAEDQISATLGDLDSSEEDSKGKKGKKGRKAMKAMKAMKAKAPAVVKAPKVFKRPGAKTKETAQVVKSGVLFIGLEITRSNWQGRSPWGNRSFRWGTGQPYRKKDEAEEACRSWLQTLCKKNSLPRFPKDARSLRF